MPGIAKSGSSRRPGKGCSGTISAAIFGFSGGTNLGRAAIQLRFSALRTFYRFLVRQGAVAASPIRNLALPKLGKRLPKFLTPQQMADLLAAPLKLLPAPDAEQAGAAEARMACRRDVAILETIYSCGLRISELCGLAVEDIDWNERLVRVRGKGKKERLVPIGEPALDAIQNYWALCPNRRRARPGLPGQPEKADAGFTATCNCA